MALKTLTPEWPLSKKVKAFCTTRWGGVSKPPYSELNLAYHVNDDRLDVEQNRNILMKELALPKAPLVINQVHSNKVLTLPIQQGVVDEFKDLKIRCLTDISNANNQAQLKNLSEIFKVDALYTRVEDEVLMILTADCVPILLCNSYETEVAAIHAGWKGIIGGIVANAVSSMNATNNDDEDDFLYAWIGPCIGKDSFEVGDDVMFKFAQIDLDFMQYFKINPAVEGKWYADLVGIVSLILQKTGIAKENIFVANRDTFTDDDFYSYRRNNITGRFASIIWLDSGTAQEQES